jgi:lysophospholipase L1-like esterase
VKRCFAASIFAVCLAVVPSFSQTKISCIGASITQGVGADPGYDYPSQLQQLLGASYSVQNEGVSGTTMLKNGDNSYWINGKLTQTFAFQPAIVTINLGGNDTKPQNWVYKDQYVPDYNAFLDTLYSRISPNIRIFLLTESKFFANTFGISDSINTVDLIPMLHQIAANRGLPVIDCHTPFLNHPEWCADGVHPNDVGADTLAHVIYRGLTTVAMISYPVSVSDTFILGQSTPATVNDTFIVSNAAITGALDSIHATHKAAWSQISVKGTPRNRQIIVATITRSALPQTEGFYNDTLTFTAASATPTSITAIIRIRVRHAPVHTRLVISPDKRGALPKIRSTRAGFITISLPDEQKYTVTLTSPSGRTIASRSVDGKETKTVVLRSCAFSAGVYVVRIASPSGLVVTRKATDF